jgi:hypothetical protein
MPLSDTQLNATFLPANPDKPLAKWVQLLLFSQFFYNMCDTTLSVCYPVGTEIEDISDYPFTTIALIALAPALMIAYCRSISALAESKHFLKTETQNTLPEMHVDEVSEPVKPNRIAYAIISGRFIGEVFDGITSVLANCQWLGVPGLQPEYRYAIYAGVSLYSFLGNVQEPINAWIALKEDNQPHNEPTDNDSKLWIYFNAFYNFSSTYLRVVYTTGTAVTDTLKWDKSIINMLAIGTLPALFFSLCESKAHAAESLHLQAGAKTNTRSSSFRQWLELPTNKKCWSLGHAISDNLEAWEAPLAVAEKFGVKGIGKVGLYTGLGVYGLFGTAQECANTIVAFAKAKPPLPVSEIPLFIL